MIKPSTPHGAYLNNRVSLCYPGDLSGPESLSLDQDIKSQQLQDAVLMPLPGAGADAPLDWAHLVDAAKAFEGKRGVAPPSSSARLSPRAELRQPPGGLTLLGSPPPSR